MIIWTEGVGSWAYTKKLRKWQGKEKNGSLDSCYKRETSLFLLSYLGVLDKLEEEEQSLNVALGSWDSLGMKC